VKIYGLLSFYDEPVADLAACIVGLHDASVDHVVAVDGAYALYPDGKQASDPNQHAAIHLACRQLGLGCTLHVPNETWAGNEVQKRTFLFQLAWTVAEEGDWFWVMDADQVITRCPDDLKDRLEQTEHDTAEVEFLDVVAQRAKQKDWPERFTVRNLFRAQSIRLEKNHITYVADDGRMLWGYDGQGKLEPHLDLSEVVEVEHRPDRRPLERQQAKLTYYAQRDASLVERGDCSLCDAPSVALVPTRWRWSDIGPVAEWAEACAPCAEKIQAVNAVELAAMGVDPDSVVAENRNGRIPEPAKETC
jgi:hypothetical protein